MSKTLYISKPGGALLQHESGEVISYDYGQKVDLEVLSPAQRNHLTHVTTTKKPAQSPPEPHEANLEAAMAEATNANTSASPVPGNYPELTEDQAVRLVQAVKNPNDLAVIIAHEMANLGREKVINAAPSSVREEAEIRAMVAEFEAEQLAETPQPPGLPGADSGESGDGDGDSGSGASTETPGGSTPPPPGPSSE